ncbi:MAG: threonine synthase [Actinobacteria bacterium]|jgi:threonine synthase|nr:threonine synthase [Actinomycetota bacterium]
MPASTLVSLSGSSSGEVYDADRLWRLDPADDRPLLATYDLEAAARTMTPASLRERPRGMWRWTELLPVRDPTAIVHLGEGDTPLVAAPRLGARLDLADLRIKAEGGNPTGSFKARGMTAAVSRNAELGATSFIAPSAGNAAGALAAYGAAAGLPVTVLMPVDAPEVNKVEVLVCGARLILVEGLISDCGRVGAELAKLTGAFDVSTLKEPYRVEGKKTMGLELAEQFDWQLPDVILYPTGGGTGLVGMWKAFAELEAMGLIGPERPRMVSVQATGCAPIVRAFESGATEAEPWQGASTRAGGIRVPGAVGDRLILQAIRASEGTAIAIDETDIDRAQLMAGSHGAGYVSPETGAVIAATGELRASGWIGRDERVVAFDTGIGAKYPPPPLPGQTPVVDPADFDPEALLASLPSSAA